MATIHKTNAVIIEVGYVLRQLKQQLSVQLHAQLNNHCTAKTVNDLIKLILLSRETGKKK